MYEAIFQKALISHNPEAILNVAYAFEGLGYHHKANALFGQLRQNVYGIGASHTKRSSGSASHKHHRHQHQQQQQSQDPSSSGGSQGGGSGGGSPSPPPNDNSETSDEDVQTDVAFGAMARGTPIKGTNGAVIPPGRYWIDLVDDTKRKTWVDLTVDKPEITIEKSEWSADVPGHVIEHIIFSVPSTASNYGLPGIFFPTQIIGFPTLAGSASNPYAVHSKADTVQRPSSMTHAEAMTEIPDLFAKGLQHSVEYVAETAGKAASSAAKGVGLGTSTLALIGVGTLVGLFLLNRLMIPSAPLSIVRKLAVHPV
jgi:hypothetical protein